MSNLIDHLTSFGIVRHFMFHDYFCDGEINERTPYISYEEDLMKRDYSFCKLDTSINSSQATSL